MEDQHESEEKLFGQRLHIFTQELLSAQQELLSKQQEISALTSKVESLEKQKAQVTKENRVLHTEIGKRFLRLRFGLPFCIP